MKKSLHVLLAVAGCAAMSSTTFAQWTPAASPFAGPYQVYPAVGDTTFKSFDIGGEVCPAGVYAKATITSDWNRTTPSLQWPDDIRGALTDAPVAGTSIIPGTVYFGGVNGVKGSTAATNNTPGPCNWTNMNFGTPFMGGSPLHFAYRTNYAGGTAGITLANIAITISPPVPAPANENCAGAIDVTAAIGAAITGPGTTFVSTPVDASGASSAPLTTPNFSCAATATRSVWFKFTPPATGVYRARSCTAAGFATANNMTLNVIGIFEVPTVGDPCAGPFTQVDCSTTTCTGGALGGTVALDASKSYYLVMARTGATDLGAIESQYQFALTRLADAPTNEACAGAIDVTAAVGAAITGPNTTFVSTPVDITSASSATITTPNFSCAATATRSVWFKFTPPSSGIYRARSCTAAGFATANNVTLNAIGIFEVPTVGDPCAGPFNQVDCSTTTCTGGALGGAVALDASKTYYLVMARTGTTALGAAEVNFQFALTRLVDAPANETCDGAIDVTAAVGAALTGPNTTFVSNAVDASTASSATLTTPNFSCAATATRSVWYKFTPPVTGQYRARSCTAAGFATANNMTLNTIGIFEVPAVDPCVGPFTQVTCGAGTTGAAACTGGILGDIVTLDASKSYYLVMARTGVTALALAEQNYQFALTRLSDNPANSVCASAEDISAAANAVLTGPLTSYVSSPKDITGTTGAQSLPSPFSCAATPSRVTWYRYQPNTTRPYTIGTCTTPATLNTMAGNVVGVFEANPVGDPCVGMTQVACSTTACTGGVSTVVSLDSTKVYYIAVARTAVTVLGTAELNSQIFIQVPDAATCSVNTETEPNDLFPESNAFTLASGDTICGTTTGTTSANTGLITSYDRFLIKTASHAGIKRNVLRMASATTGHSLSIMGLNQTAGGVIGTTDTVFQTASTSTTPARAVCWYTFGNSIDPNDRVVSVRVGGTTTTTAQYSANLDISDVIPATLSRDIKPGSIVLTTRGQGHSSDTDMYLFDADFNILGSCDDSKVDTASVQSDLTRTLAAGTYYIAVGSYNTASNLASVGADDDFLTGNVLRYPGTLAHGTGTTTLNQNVAMKITDVDGAVLVPLTLTDTLFNIAWVKMVVAIPGNGGCQPADIADDQGFPLPSANINSGVNEGDYNAFFGGFFDALAYCDQWDDAGNPLPSAGVNSGVNEGDYNGFFATFFNGCP